MDFYSNMEKKYGQLPDFVKSALVLMGFVGKKNFSVVRESQFDALIADLSAQIIRISNGNCAVDDVIKIEAQQHIAERGFNSQNYELPLLLREIIHNIYDHYKKEQKDKDVSLDGTKVSQLKAQLITAVEREIVVKPGMNFNEIKIIQDQAKKKCFGICFICKQRVSVWDTKSLHFRSSQYVRHLIESHQLETIPKPPRVKKNRNKSTSTTSNASTTGNAEKVSKIKIKKAEVKLNRVDPSKFDEYDILY